MNFFLKKTSEKFPGKTIMIVLFIYKKRDDWPYIIPFKNLRL